MTDSPTIPEPFPIFFVSKLYLLYDADVITYIRREHHICGVLIGSLPQIPQQNVFLGVPLELMSEEVRLLVDKGAAFVVNDASLHKARLPSLTRAGRSAFGESLLIQGKEAARTAHQQAGQRQEKALRRLKANGKSEQVAALSIDEKITDAAPDECDEGKSFFQDSSTSAPVQPEPSTEEILAFGITPTTSYPPFPVPSKPTSPQLVEVPNSYAIYAHLHSKDYYLSPGLRFGCQYLVYPGDPLRFHSHFLAVGKAWDEEFELLDLVGGGRLGTGVKKGFLIGGLEGADTLKSDEESRDKAGQRVRTFCIEWGGM
ncbi:MAG: tRNA-splicing endonuclease subunit [Candelina submexicana]|nr:MAG: tRNA-splicing endonuclease subunit [Candelina submexicana]